MNARFPFSIPDHQKWLFASKNPVCGIYQIKNENTGRIYIGSSANMNKRMLFHGYELMGNRHANQYLQASYNKHGPVFVFSCVEVCDRDKLIEREDAWILATKCRDRRWGYNMQAAIRDDSEGRWNKEVLSKISESNKKNFKENPERTEKAIARLTEWHKKNPGVAGGPRKNYTYQHRDGRIFFGCANELVRKYPDEKLQQSHIWELSTGKAKSHKGWKIIKS